MSKFVRHFVLSLWVVFPVACGSDAEPCLYGRPNANTGLGPSECAPRCGGFRAPELSAAQLDDLDSWLLDNPPDVPTGDPYEGTSPLPDTSGVCAAQIDSPAGRYRLDTYATTALAEAAGAVPTHTGACGLCSSLADLATYARNGDLTEPVRACGLEGLNDGEAANIQCLVDLGFSPPCAQIWFYNTRNTRRECVEACFLALGEVYHLEDGSLNACLQCDEDRSGPVFKAHAGRTRRNSGLASALCRPCDGVARITHDYW